MNTKLLLNTILITNLLLLLCGLVNGGGMNLGEGSSLKDSSTTEFNPSDPSTYSTDDWQNANWDAISKANNLNKVPPEQIANIPAKYADPTKVKDPTKLTSDQLIGKNSSGNYNIDKIALSKLDSEQADKALTALGRKTIQSTPSPQSQITTTDSGFEVNTILEIDITDNDFGSSTFSDADNLQ